jgi:hypothetical protein
MDVPETLELSDFLGGFWVLGAIVRRERFVTLGFESLFLLVE